MNGKLWAIALVTVVIVTLGGLFLVARGQAPAGSTQITATEADAGKTIKLHVGDTLVVALDGNPTTGYTWEREKNDDGVLVQAGDPEFEPASQALGAAGKMSLRFEAKARGETTLNLVYHRSWESEAPEKVFALTVIVD